MAESPTKAANLEEMEKSLYPLLRIDAFDIDREEAWKVANSRKGYWRMSKNQTIHRAINKKRLASWGLKDLNQLYQRRYLSY